jgi:hypothetical protein
MLFKGQVWEFYLAQQKITEKSFKFICSDDAITQLIKKSHFSDYRTLQGQELTVDWLEENFSNLSLFASSDKYFVTNFAKISTVSLDWLNQNEVLLNDQEIIFHIDKSLNAKKLKAINPEIIIEPIKFWETSKLIGFYLDYKKLKYRFDVPSFIEQKIENTPTEIFNAINILSVMYPGEEIDIEKIKSSLTLNFLDQFSLAELYNKKNLKAFFHTLSNDQIPNEDFLKFSYFMQGHVMKVIDPSYAKEKKKLSKYDRSIQDAHHLWKRDQLLRSLEMFSTLERKAKFNEGPSSFMRGYYVKMLS